MDIIDGAMRVLCDDWNYALYDNCAVLFRHILSGLFFLGFYCALSFLLFSIIQKIRFWIIDRKKK